MKALLRVVGWISDLRVAIVLLLVIAITSGVGTAIPQREPADLYHRLYDPQPWLGLLNGDGVLALQLDHVYSSGWFLGLLAWLALALLLCSWRRQWPALQTALRWVDYQSPRQLSKLSVAETVASQRPAASLVQLEGAVIVPGIGLREARDREFFCHFLPWPLFCSPATGHPKGFSNCRSAPYYGPINICAKRAFAVRRLGEKFKT